MSRFLGCALLLAAASAAAQSPAQVHVTVEGAVLRPSTFALSEDARLSDPILAAMPTSEAYTTGAALLRRQAVVPQTRLRAGLEHSLQAIQTAEDTPLAVAETAARMEAWLTTLPVTGRIPTQLDGRRLEVDPGANLPVRDGDRLVYPLRPDTIAVVGAVEAPCRLPHVALREAAKYLRQCPTLGADPDLLYVVQPDGSVAQLGIAPWNRSPAQTLAPGAVLYAPLPERTLRRIDPDFNREFAQFLATQPIALPVSPRVQDAAR
ncbi:capsule biosynthesis GfcC family protein [Luteimonas sp. TWI1416]|uniref:capsule biosynthesis GfcC family protein n=1 Tax=unclassified Luteimonas TaxID=2629088 RepID=UPI003209C5AA